MGGRERGVGQVVEQPQFFAQQEGAVEPAVGLLDFPERRELMHGLVFRAPLAQRAHSVADAAGMEKLSD